MSDNNGDDNNDNNNKDDDDDDNRNNNNNDNDYNHTNDANNDNNENGRKTAQTPTCFWHISLHMKMAYCYKCVMICLTIDYLAIVVTTLHTLVFLRHATQAVGIYGCKIFGQNRYNGEVTTLKNVLTRRSKTYRLNWHKV